ncbi:Uu.00g078990.m01.CDS01 [Anthostomella pinea]|uniref:Uu.00g078990.m01.CDS01 n=1 Tax=Anthostomella pinea TaxID=933095 RepID=A0AAI8VFC2_9PEZI|nr:Uu.00g078990.m01.CDS01 [Anthostomella pinea]
MASHFQIQKPYVLTPLPRPLDPSTGRYVVGNVYGSTPGSRKRKRRHELTLGIDGEAVNIYDVSSARLVTSYPIPPQCRISCPIHSIRQKLPGTKAIARYTYAAIDESPVQKITLFKDHVDASGKPTSITQSTSLGSGLPIVSLTTVVSPNTQLGPGDSMPHEDLMAVREDGEIICFDSENLQKKWSANSTAMQQDLAEGARTNFKVQFCRAVSTADVIKGILRGNSEAFGLLSGSEHGQTEDAEVLVIVSSSGPASHPCRHLHIVGLHEPHHGSLQTQQGIFQLHVVPIVPPTERSNKPCLYHLDARTGTLLELQNQTLTIHDMAESIPKITATMSLEGATSFLHLSKTSLLCSTNTQLNVYNPVFKSLQETVDVDLENQAQPATEPNKAATACQLVAFFSRLELAIAIVDSNLVAIQLEAPAQRKTKRRAEGLLIDSIGRGLKTSKRISTQESRKPPKDSVFSNLLPGSIRGDYWQQWTADETKADALLNANKIHDLEVFLAEKFGIQTKEDQRPDGTSHDGAPLEYPTWLWPKARTGYPPCDRRWILYAISRAFSWIDALPGVASVPRLLCQLPQSNIVNYLLDAGHMTLSNVKAAFRGKLSGPEQADSFLAEQLITRIAGLDPTLELTVTYLSATNLGAVELLIVVRTIMRSLELMQNPKEPPPKLLTNGSVEEPLNEDEAVDPENIGMELDDLEDEIQKTVSYLNEDAGIRGTGLSVAFAKLGSCPGISMIKALRTIFKPEEILSLVYILRVELVKGAWTSRYLDDTEFEKDPALDAPPDGSIKLIADLLGRCVDSIGPGGWLLNDAILAGDDAGDFVASLKLEVSAALEGVLEAVGLRGSVGEAVKFCELSQKAVTDDLKLMKPIPLHVRELGAEALPLGLRSSKVSSLKVVSGGEIVERSQRETGHLVSQQVGSYSLERIAI